MKSRHVHVTTALAAITLGAVIIVWSVDSIAPDRRSSDFLCFWTAGKLVASDQDPYDPALQIEVQRAYGWDVARDGRGIFEFLPFYYPYWFAAFCALLVPLGISAAKTAWFFLNAWMLLASGVLAGGLVPNVPRSIPTVLVPAFFLSIVALFLGQTTILILFLLLAAWGLMERGWDFAGGVVAAGLTTKPQLGGILIAALMLWALRRGRWRIVGGFVLGLSVLSLGSALLLPPWPLRMLDAMRRTAPPTAYFPWIGASWLLILKLVGLRSAVLWAGYLAVAIPALLLVARAAFDRSRPLRDTIALGVLAAFFVAPYARHYDYPILLTTFLVLLGCRLPERWGAALTMAVVFLPYLQFGLLMMYKERAKDQGDFVYESTYFWIPTLLLAAWVLTRDRYAVSIASSVREDVGESSPAPRT